MDNYKPNSHRSKEEVKQPAVRSEKRVEKVIKGTARTKKKSGVTKLTDIFISEDAANVKSYILMDVLVPAVKKAISDIVTDGIDMILFGGTGRSKKSSNTSYVSYSGYSNRERNRPAVESRVKTRFDYDDIVFETRGEATEVREKMDEVIEKYGFVTVADMYDMADLSAPYTSFKYGWTDIRSAEPVRLAGGGYVLKLPKALPID